MKIRVLFFIALAILLEISSSSRAQWVRSGLEGSTVRKFAIVDSLLFAATDNGMFRTSNDGRSWEYLPNILRDDDISDLVVSGQVLLIGTCSGPFTSSDLGKTWLRNPDTSFHFVCNSTFTALDSLLFTGDGGLYRSSDRGRHWGSLKFTKDQIYSLSVVDEDLFACVPNSGLYRSTNRGITWTLQDVGLSNQWVNTVATCGKEYFAATLRGPFISMDSCRTWDLFENDLSISVATYCFEVFNENIFAGAGSGVYLLIRTDGYHWLPVHPNLSDSSVLSLMIHDGYLFAGTFKGGVWRRPLSEMIATNAVATKPVARQSLTIYPNPTTTSTTISITPEASGYAEISIVNMLGQTVAHVHSGVLDASEHHFTWVAQAKARATGVYECVVRMNGRVQMLPIMVE